MLQSRWWRKSSFLGLLSAALILTSSPASQAAGSVYFSSRGAGCSTAYNSGTVHAQRLYVTSTSTITTLNIAVGSGTTTNFNTSRFYLMGDNATTIIPSGTLATFTPDSISGTGVNTVAKYTGNYTATAGTFIWFVAGQNGSNFPLCYWNNMLVSDFVLGGINPDTSTSGTANTYKRAYIAGGTTPFSGTWTSPLADSLVWQFSLESNVVTPVTASLSSQSGSLKTDFRTATALNVNVDTPSKVTFYANGKVIAKCRNILSSAGVATCNWLPSVHGSYRIFATANPISTSYIASSTSIININVAPRTNKR
jgi:hypothetical protein